MKFVAIIHPTIKKGKTFIDYRKAWYHTCGFGIPIKMHTVINALNPRELITIAISGDIDEEIFLEKLPKVLNIDIKERLITHLMILLKKQLFGILVLLQLKMIFLQMGY